MSYQEKRSLVGIISTLLILGFYSLYVFNRYHDIIVNTPNDFKFWGKTFIILIPVQIVAQIIVQIIFTIINKIVTNEDLPTITDERDKLIQLKATRISHATFLIGFLLAMASQAFGMQPWVMFITLVGSGFVAATADEIAKIYLYRKGV
jgi:VanZ family protein